MSDAKKPVGRQRRPLNGSSQSVKIHRSFGDRVKASRFARSTRKADYLSTLPKEPWKRILYRLEPQRLARYWFSREGAIMALKILGVGIVAMFLLVIGLFAYFRKDLPKINDISGDKIGGSITYYDRTGQTVLWEDNNGVKRTPVEGNQMSPYIRQATVAVEDKDFYKHGAFDVRGIMRAGVHDLTGGGGTQGGSTITQQLVKLNEQWTDNRTITRKVKELILAVELEREYSKDDILTAYLNVAPYGGVENGVEAASRDYFGVSAKDLTLPEAAMLAAIPKSPYYYSPYSSTQFNPASGNSFDKSMLTSRMDYILDQMATQKMITTQQAADAKKADVLALVHQMPTNKYEGIKAPYFVLAAKQELMDKYGESTVKRGGWKVITTLDSNLQSTAEQLVQSNLPNLTSRTHGLGDEEATVTEDVQTGQIVALVGGTNFNDPDHGQNNYASSIAVGPGSSFKPYDYSAFIDNNNNVGAGSVLYDSQDKLPGYTGTCPNPPKTSDQCAPGTAPYLYDYDLRYPGPITVRYALGGSRNVPAVKAMLSAVPNDTSAGKTNSINKTVSTATAMMDNPYVKGSTYACATGQCYPSSAIGDGALVHLDDHVNGLSTLARMGNAIPRTYILQINDASNKTIYKWTQPKGKQVIKQDTAYIMDNMLSDPNASYLPGSCTATNCSKISSFGYKFHHDNGWDFAIKTGTTNNGFDGLMTSWSTKYAVVSWVGNHTRNVNLQEYGATMELLTEPLTRGMMEAAHANLKPVNWTQPSDIKTLPSFVVRSKISTNGEIVPSSSTDIYPSWYAGGSSKTNSSQTIDKVSGKTVTNCTPQLARETLYNSNADSWNVDQWHGGKPSVGSASTGSSNSSTTTAYDDVHNCGDAPPTVTLTAPDNCPASGCTITVSASQGTHDLSGGSYTDAPAGTIAITLGDQTIKTFTMDQTDVYSNTFTYTPTTSGTQTLTATVVDSVLYSGSDSKTVNFTAGQPLTFQGATHSHQGGSNTTTIKWSGGSGTYTVTNNGNTICTAQAGATSCDANGNITGQIVITDSSGNSANGSA